MLKQRPSFPAKLAPGLPQPKSRAVAASAALRSAVRGMSKTPMAHDLAHGMDSSAVRMNMVAKLRLQGTTDPVVLGAMGRIERHRFVDSALVNQAYEDTSLPIGLGQTISKPSVVSRMVELLRQNASGKLGRVLEIGTGCGYQAAVLGQLATEVYSIERLRGLHDKARDNLRYLALPNVHLLLGDGMAGYAKGAPYAGIISAAGGDGLPQAWIDQLAVGGRLVAPVSVAGGAKGQQALMVVDKTDSGVKHTILEAVLFVPLKSGIA